MPGRDVVLALLHGGKDGTQVEQNGNEAHIGQILVMLHPRAADRRHQVAAKEAEFRLRVFPLQGSHQVRGVQVAGGFADYEVILHEVNTRISVHPSDRRR